MADQPTDQGEGAPSRPRRGFGLAATAVAAGLVGLAASLNGLAIGILPRHFTPAEQQKIVSWEIGKRWRTWAAGQIFPARIAYELPGASLASTTGLTLTARRVGIMPEASCLDATDTVAAKVLATYGCEAVLRAIYSDATGAFVTTVGIAVLPDAKAGAAAHGALAGSGGEQPGVRAAGLPGTLTASFTDSGRQVSSSIASGPYLVMYTAGYADGRPRETADANQYAGGELLRVSESIAGDIAAKIGAQPPLPRCPGSPGC
ncbi:MAG: hypothetical protein ACM3ML_26160 [Micromonosporaceae bacterium]